MILAFASLLLGTVGIWVAVADLRDFRRHRRDYSDWIVSGASRLEARLWRFHARMRLVSLVICSPLLLGLGIWLATKN